ncbi:MAG: hypothetical protein ACK56F_01885, partial [bacterium]
MVPRVGDPVVVAQPVARVVATQRGIFAAQADRARVGAGGGRCVPALHGDHRAGAVGAIVLAHIRLQQFVVVLLADSEGIAPNLAPVLRSGEPLTIVARVHGHAETDLAQVVEAIGPVGLGFGLRQCRQQ